LTSNTFTHSKEEKDDDPELLMRKFEAYCNPKRKITYERHIFNTHMQGLNENIDAYVTELRLQKQKTLNLAFSATN
jgi:hypothetical protein